MYAEGSGSRYSLGGLIRYPGQPRDVQGRPDGYLQAGMVEGVPKLKHGNLLEEEDGGAGDEAVVAASNTRNIFWHIVGDMTDDFSVKELHDDETNHRTPRRYTPLHFGPRSSRSLTAGVGEGQGPHKEASIIPACPYRTSAQAEFLDARGDLDCA